MPTSATDPQVAVWYAELDDRAPGQPPATPAALRLRAHRFLRGVVASRLDVPAQDIIIDRGACPACGAPHGAPEVARPGASGLQISLSYSRGRCLVGISGAGPIGVDIQAVTSAARAERLAERILSPGEAAMLERPSAAPHARRVLGSWARKEACLKAVGLGIVLPMRDVDVGVPPAPRDAPVNLNGQHLSVVDVPVGPAWVGAVSMVVDL